MSIEFTPLPYPRDALAPHVSPETLEYHHGKHHKAYVEKLNQLIAGTEHDRMSLEEIVRSSTGAVFNNAAQARNHAFFWNCLSPRGGGEPAGAPAEAIRRDFGSVDALREKFTQACIQQFGSGWGWLVRARNGSLEIRTTPNAQTPLTEGDVPLLACDVWEHAYYIDYRNRRADFLAAFWKIVNWDFVAGRLGK